MHPRNSKTDQEHSQNQTRSVFLSKFLLIALLSLAVAVLNVLLRLKLPGVTEIDLRPQIVLLLVVGYVYGPWPGFLAGIGSNLVTDLWLGHGMDYFLSWTIGNGFLGALLGVFRRWRAWRIEKIGQLAELIVAVLLVNLAAVAYAALIMHGVEGVESRAYMFRNYYVPAILANTVSCLIFLPILLLALGQMKRTYPVVLALTNYYLIITAFLVFAFVSQGTNMLAAVDAPALTGVNEDIASFSNWAFLLLVVLLVSFALSSWLAKLVGAPLEELSDSVVALLRGDIRSSKRLSDLAKRPDEVGLASFAVKLLGERMLEAQKTATHALEKDLKCVDAADSGSDLFTVALVMTFGRDALKEIWESGDAVDDTFTLLSAVRLMLSLCGLRELAATYTKEQIARSFSGLETTINSKALTSEDLRAFTAAMDTGLLCKGRLKVIDPQEPLNRESAFHLMERCQVFLGSPKKYIGFVTEPDILGRMTNTWNSLTPVREEHFEQLLDKALCRGLITGYIMKRKGTLSGFDPELRIEYSHNSFTHIKQLLGLLRSESIQAKLQLEPVRTSFFYRPEWGLSPDLHIDTQANGPMIARKDEHELVMEFVSHEDRDRFHNLIENHAKHNLQHTKEALYDSWFQPLYRSYVPLKEYVRSVNLTIENDDTMVCCYVLESNASKVMEDLQRVMPGMLIKTSSIWINTAFARYLEGFSD